MSGFYSHMASQEVLVIKNLSAIAGDAGDSGSILGLGRSPGGGNSNPLHYSCLGNPMDRGAWWATVLGVGKASDVTKHSKVLEEIIEGFILFPHGGGDFRSCLSI